MVAAPDTLLPARMTIEEWANMNEDEPGEFVDGYLVEEEVPICAHEAIVSWFIGELRKWGKPKQAFVFPSDHKFALSPVRGRKPDVSMFAPRERLPYNRGLTRTPPRLMVEVLSATPRDVKRDRVEKMAEYARFGVQSYWIVDPPNRSIEFYELGADGRYSRAAIASQGQFVAPGFDNLVLDLDDLWGEVDLLARDDGEPSES